MLSKKAVDALASDIAQKLNYFPGGELEPIIKRLGGKIIISSGLDLYPNSSGSIRIRSSSDFEITIARHTGATRDRFTLAHELGHYVLHYLWPKESGHDPGWIEAHRYGSGRTEWEANWFAAGFLMPEQTFREAYKANFGNVQRIASEFDVSTGTVDVRIATLGLK